jgi:hypothetical protein
MAGTRIKDSQEFTSDQLRAELIDIKERVGSLETISSLAHREVIEAYISGILKNDAKKKSIMKACEQPLTRNTIRERFSFASDQAVDYHLTPLRHSALIHEGLNAENAQVFQWSKMFRNLPRATRDRMLS